MRMLAIETSTEACSVALWIDGDVLERFEVAPRRHTELVLPWADELLAAAGLAKSGLDAIAVGRGPGAFTGVRLAVALVQGMALALDIPVVPVSTLAALALRADIRAGEMPILAAIDARMDELYLGLFTRDPDRLIVPAGEEWMARPADTLLPGDFAVTGVGSGFAAGAGALAQALGARLQHFDANALPHAADIACLGALSFARGEAIAADLLEPAYLRNKVAFTLKEQAAAKANAVRDERG